MGRAGDAYTNMMQADKDTLHDLEEMADEEAERERITGVAIMYGSDMQTLDRPARHGDIISMMASRGIRTGGDCTQGFVTNTGRFLNRWQALRFAVRAKQCPFALMKRGLEGELFSEDLW